MIKTGISECSALHLVARLNLPEQLQVLDVLLQ